jgi:ankyrin repeat protein
MLVFLFSLLIISPACTDILAAAKKGDTTTVQKLLAEREKANKKDKDGWTPLIWATVRNDPATVKALLNGGALVNMKDNYGWTALMWAENYSHTEITRLLRQAEAQHNKAF